MTNRLTASLAALLLAATASLASAESFDWPQWNGPDRNAVSKEQSLLKEWPKDGPPLAWKTDGLGSGYGAPAVAAGNLYGLSNRTADEIVWARSESTGKELWSVKLAPAAAAGMPQGKEGSGCTPTVDGDRLYVLGLNGDLACLQTKDGKILWQLNLTKDFNAKAPMWRFNESPLVDGDKVICTPGTQDAMLVALDKLTGKTLWKTQMPAPAAAGGGSRGGPGGGRRGAAYASAIAADFNGQRQIIQFTAKSLLGVSASDGKLLWRYNKPANPMGINCASPIYQDGLVFAASAYGAGGGLVKLSKDADGTIKADEVYSTNKMLNHHGGMILVDGCLYGANGGNEGGYLVCLDFQTGKVNWDEREGQRRAPKGSLALADNRLYYRTEKGTILLLQPSPKEYLERGRFEQPDRTSSPAWTHPVIANGKLYIRDQDTLYCYNIKSK